MPFQHSKAAYTFKEFLQIASIGKNTGLMEIRDRRLVVIRVGRRRKKILIPAASIDQWLSARQP